MDWYSITVVCVSIGIVLLIFSVILNLVFIEDKKSMKEYSHKSSINPIKDVKERLQKNNIQIKDIQLFDDTTMIIVNDAYLSSIEVEKGFSYHVSTYKYYFNGFVFYTSKMLDDEECRILNKSFSVVKSYLKLKNDLSTHSKEYDTSFVGFPGILPMYNEYKFRKGYFKNSHTGINLYMQIGNTELNIKEDTTIDDLLKFEKEAHNYVNFEYIDLSDWVKDTEEINGYKLSMIEDTVFADKTSEFMFHVDFFRNVLAIFRDKVKLMETDIKNHAEVIRTIEHRLKKKEVNDYDYSIT